MIWVIYPAVILSVASENLESPSPEHSYTLRNGRKMPVMGFRVPETPELLSWAFRLGYRMTETSHRSASQAMRETQLPRAEFFVSTQISSHGFDEAHRAIRQSLRQLRLDYVDLLLLAPWEGKLIETWDSMVEMNKMGLVRSLGFVISTSITWRLWHLTEGHCQRSCSWNSTHSTCTNVWN